MNIGVYFIKSNINKGKFEDTINNIIGKLENSEFKVENQGLISEKKQIKGLGSDLYLLVILTGGTENLIKEFEKFDTPVILRTNSDGNSLPSAIEAREYLRGKIPLEIIHEDPTLQESIMDEELEEMRKKLKGDIASIGGSSNWLIASEVKKERLKDFGINIEHISAEKMIKRINNTEVNPKKANEVIQRSENLKNEISDEKVEETTKIYEALKELAEKRNLNAITVRCIDLIEEVGTTFCLPLSLLNDDGIIAGCEGDPRSLMGMILGKIVSQKPTYMGNLADYDKETITLSHCTIPLDITDNFTLTTHYETDSGVAIKGNIKQKKVTVFGLDKDLRNAVITEGTIIGTEENKEMCRTQLKISVENAPKFMERAFGNHQIVTFAQKNKVEKFLNYIGIKTC